MTGLRWKLLGGAWTVAVFGGVFWLTFPSEALGQRLSYQVRKATDGAWDLKLDGARPWWVGVQGANVIVSKRGDGGAPEPVFFADQLGLRVGAWSLLRRAPAITGTVTLGSGTLDVFVRTVLPTMDVRAVEVHGDGVDLGDLLAILPGGPSGLGITGDVDVDVDLQLANGLGKTDGSIRLVGEGLTLDTITVESLGWIDKELGATVDAIDLEVDFDEGKGEVSEGTLATSLADLDVSGDVELADAFERSRLDLQVVLDLDDWAGSPLEPMRSIVDGRLAEATHADGKAHYELATTLGRLDLGDLRPARERGGRSSSRAVTPPTTANEAPPPGEPTDGIPAGADGFRVPPAVPPPMAPTATDHRRPTPAVAGDDEEIDREEIDREDDLDEGDDPDLDREEGDREDLDPDAEDPPLEDGY